LAVHLPLLAIHLMRILLAIGGIGLLSACLSRNQDRPGGEPQLLRIVATDFSFSAPASIPAGLTRIRLANQGRTWHEALITRLPDGVTAEAYIAGARAGEAFPVSAIDAGGPGIIAPGDSSEVVLGLEPGTYAIVCWSDNHVKTAGMVVTVLVTEPSRPVDTARVYAGVDGEISLANYQFVHSTPFRAGRQLLRVRNASTLPHDLSIYRLEEGRTLQDFASWYAIREGTPPAVPVGGTSTISQGHELLLDITLGPGRYFAACATPEGDKIHAQLGMIEEFEIAEP
jgi:hypothetical protein